MHTPAVFHWHGPDARRFQGQGSTRDMSVDGVFVITATCPPVNAILQIEVIFPLSDGTSKAHMKAEMMVLRVDHDLTGVNPGGFSAVGNGFSLSTTTERASRAMAEMIDNSRSEEGGEE